MTEAVRMRGLDAMRALVVVGLIFFHALLVFDTRDDYYVKNDRTADLTPLAALGVVWAMPLLFLTAGLGTWHSLGRRGRREFARERLRRLLVPLVFGVLVLMPVPVWLRLRTDPGYDESYPDFYPRFLHVRLDWSDFPFVVQDAPPDRLFETGQLWFLVLLLAFSLLLLPLLSWLRAPGREALRARWAGLADRPGGILLPAVPLALTSAAFEMEEPHAAWSRWAYLLFFLFGFVLASDGRYLSAMRRHVPVAIALGLAGFAAGFALIGASADAGGDPFVDYRPLSVGGRLLFGATGWLWLVAILGLLARPRAGSSAAPLGRRDRILDQAGEAVLPVYVLHQPVLVLLAFFVVGWSVPSPAKYALIVVGTLLVVVAGYLLIRRIRPARFVFGMRPPPSPAARPSAVA